MENKSAHALLEGATLPVIAAPMFLVSSPALVYAACRAGVIGAFPGANARTIEDFESWCKTISEQTSSSSATSSGSALGAAWAVNLIVHSTYVRAAEELAVVKRYRPRLVITSLGSPSRTVEAVHAYGGFVFADVTSVAFARKAAASGVDGLVLVCAGAGGHTGTLSPFAFVSAVREFWKGTLVLAGAISDGRGIRAAQSLGADLVYVGTRFIATEESLAVPKYKQMLVDSQVDDIVPSKAITGVTANWLAPSLAAAGWTKERLGEAGQIDFSGDIGDESKAWKNVWSAGQGVGAVKHIAPVAAVVEELRAEYQAAAMLMPAHWSK